MLLITLYRMTSKERSFQKLVWEFYRTEGRHDLPWRKTSDPYRIVVSEVMLQQTQVARVMVKYEAFIQRWGSVRALARASLSEVLTAWQGLGYNSRAKRLHECARLVTYEYKGRWPKTYDALLALPGIGPYTAAAVMAFAYNQAVPLIETNVRTVYLHHFFKDKENVTDAEIVKVVERTLDDKRPREWYWALMDYGAHLKQVYGNQNIRSKNYKKQSRFKGSDREIRGGIVRCLSGAAATLPRLQNELGDVEPARVEAQLARLVEEGLVEQRGQSFALPA